MAATPISLESLALIRNLATFNVVGAEISIVDNSRLSIRICRVLSK
jgi:hypothetical protein